MTRLFYLLFLAVAHADQKPNILFIAIDDLNDWIGCLDGHPQTLTPNIDHLASRGILFTNAHCTSPACKPSRAAIFSGLMPQKTGVWSNKSKSLRELRPDILKLPQAFAKAGYQTLGSGKLHHSSNCEETFLEYFKVGQRWSPITQQKANYLPTELRSKGTNNPRHVVQIPTGNEIILPLNRMPSDRAPNSLSGESFDWGEWSVPDTDFGDTKITNWAISKLKKTNNQPLFLAVGYYRPHIPLWAPKRFFTRFKNNPGERPPVINDDLADLGELGKIRALEADTAGLHETVTKHKQWSKAIEAYLSCISYVDEEIGRLIKALDRTEYSENTIIILWSDHGWHLGEKQHWGKWTGWERSTRVPLIIVPPKNKAQKFAPGGSKCHSPVSLIDLYPTLASLCEIEGPKNLDGESLIPLLKDTQIGMNRKVITTFNPGNYSIRTSRWRYILYENGEQELYDMIKDPNEWHNLAGLKPYKQIMQSIRKVID